MSMFDLVERKINRLNNFVFSGSFGFEGAKGDKGAKGVQGVPGAQVIISIVFF